MNFNINKIIYLYILICIVLLLYNLFFVFYSRRQRRKHHEYYLRWRRIVRRQLNVLSRGANVEQKHKMNLEKYLIHINQLISYSHVLDTLRDKDENIDEYLKEIYTVIESLANKYKKKEVSERSFFAFFISNNPPSNGKEYNYLTNILVSYLDDSDIYCRENVLKALYALGNSQAIENAFQIINERGWFHHHKLLSDGLMTFTGDKEELLEKMWNYFKIWDENMIISIIRFATEVSDKFKEKFYLMLKSEDVGRETKIAIIRYYKRYAYEPIRLILIDYLREENTIDDNIKIVVAFVLDNYPGDETISALLNALNNPNWHIRYNAARSLKKLEVDISMLNDIMTDDKHYAKEVLCYLMNFHEEADAA